MALFYLAHLIAFIIIGPVAVGETNELILWAEIVLFVGITVLALERFLSTISGVRSKALTRYLRREER